MTLTNHCGLIPFQILIPSCGHDDRQLEQTLVYQLCSFVFFFVCLFFVDFLSTSLSSSVECFGGQ